MPVVLLDADDHIIAAAVGVLGFADCQVDGFVLGVAMADDFALLVHHVPAVLGFVVIDMKGVVGTGLGCWFGHDQRPLSALLTFLRLLPTFFTALRTVAAFFFVFFAS